jgi:hypothetical protein
MVWVVGVGRAFLKAGRPSTRVRPVRTGDRQGDVYVAVLIAVSWRQRKRAFDTRALDPDPSGGRLAFDPYRPPKWHKLEAGLQAFGSEPVCAAAQAASSADLAATGALAEWSQDHSKGNRSAARQARKAADDADDLLVERIRQELRDKGTPFADWQPGLAGDGVVLRTSARQAPNCP